LEIGDIINTASVVIAAGSFVWGVRAWRSSYIGQKRIELAEEVYGLLLKCTDHIQIIRSPFGYEGEGSTRKRAENETPEESEIYDRAYVAIERFAKVQEDFSNLFALAIRFELYFGSGAAGPIRTLREIVQEIHLASRRLNHYWRAQGKSFPNDDAFQQHLERMHEAEGVFWEDTEEVDKINPRLFAAREQIEEICRNAIAPQPNIWRSLKNGMLWVENFFETKSVRL
jgi:hypothetical protein